MPWPSREVTDPELRKPFFKSLSTDRGGHEVLHEDRCSDGAPSW